MSGPDSRSAAAIAADVRAGRTSAEQVARDALADIARRDPPLNAFTRLLPERALADARAVDAKIARGIDPGPLAGVPFAVKDLFDVAGIPTTAGAALRRDASPAARDADAITSLNEAGGVLVGTLNMDEFAYGFATDNAHFGLTRNPHDPDRIAGGSSGGSAAAVAAGLVPLSLGSDTNGSIRVPAALCGLYGLRATQGGLSRRGAFPFAASFDMVGPFARSVADMRLIFDALAGCRSADVPAEGLRVGRLEGWFRRNASEELLAGIDRIADHFGGAVPVELPEAERARAAAFLITAAEGGNLHLPDLRSRAMAYDPATRDRLLAGAMLPAATYIQAQRFRGWARDAALALFDRFDLLVAPGCPGPAPRIASATIMVEGKPVSARANLGLYTQPLTLIGLPVLSVPLARPGELPLGVQLIAAPGREDLLFAAAAALEEAGIIGFSEPVEMELSSR
ncbi:AtzE family amidohydrolase [Sphingomonas oleivorans]|uniref:AtzE family amidohydrolase n=1 Tax=Sphingomonas oleivorans TaxID=1735121 RepID=A0A2T5FYA5_9SPHN|nr:AtzE family amidohydrolase [Sphingomonas oleivorans]PTQ11517.1 AtzE family amidohydrolase [Sphingomonas oleivorans]